MKKKIKFDKQKNINNLAKVVKSDGSRLFNSVTESSRGQSQVLITSREEAGVTGTFTQGFTRDLKMLNITWDFWLLVEIRLEMSSCLGSNKGR